MTKLTDTQLVILSTASARDDRLVLPLPKSIKGGAAKKLIESLIAKGLIEEIDASPGEPAWRDAGSDDGRPVPTTLVATDAAFAALGIEGPGPATTPAKRTRPKKARGPAKKDRLVELLRRENGATIEELMAEFGWQAHTVRGAISIAATRLGVTAERIEKRRYRLPTA
jgi:hypothetical protein